MKEELLARYRNLITGVVSVDHRIREGIEQYKAKLLLADGSNLRVSEVWIDGELTKYSYYWLDESDNLVAGWDNAAHRQRSARFLCSQPGRCAGLPCKEDRVRRLCQCLAQSP